VFEMSNNIYLELKRKHQEESNNFPFMFAFSKEQFAEGMQKLDLNESDTDKIYSIGGGGYIRKTDSEAMHEMFNRHEKEMKEAINNDITGEQFIFDMFNYELANHEYTYTGTIEDTINALALTIDEINNNERLLNGLKKACNGKENTKNNLIKQ
jgi:hypothetical protein